MRAVICRRYGGPEVLQIENVEKPSPNKNEILVRVISTSVISADVRVRALAVESFMKIMMRFALGFTKPRKPILGTIFSGIVEYCGKNFSRFKPRDEGSFPQKP